MTQLPIKPGIDGIPTGLIPTDPAAFVDWFKNSFLPRWAANADARNAIPTSSSVVITGDTNTPAGIGIGPNSITNAELVQRAPLSVMGNPTAAEANVQDIVAGADNEALQRIGGVLLFAPVVPTITVADSITGLGSPASPLQLVGDVLSPGTSQYYGTDGSGTKGFFSAAAGANIQTFTQAGGSPQTYTVPPGKSFLQVICIGGGGGGSSGGFNASGSVVTGGGGGGGGGVSVSLLQASLVSPTVSITFSNTATGGAGGASQTVSPNTGKAGTGGSNVVFGPYIAAIGGTLGSASGTGGSGGQGIQYNNIQAGTTGGTGGGGAAGNGGVGTAAYTVSGGGGGGGIPGTPLFKAGGQGGNSTSWGIMVGGLPGTTIGGSGFIGSAGNGLFPATGGGGGASGTALVSGGAGGAGGAFGGGGGGGGAANNTAPGSGAGGAGGLAACIIIAF